LVFAASPLSMLHEGERAKTGGSQFTGKIKVHTNTKKLFLVLFNKIVISDLIVICDKIS
jgi:hypothetical protein